MFPFYYILFFLKYYNTNNNINKIMKNMKTNKLGIACKNVFFVLNNSASSFPISAPSITVILKWLEFICFYKSSPNHHIVFGYNGRPSPMQITTLLDTMLQRGLEPRLTESKPDVITTYTIRAKWFLKCTITLFCAPGGGRTRDFCVSYACQCGINTTLVYLYNISTTL